MNEKNNKIADPKEIKHKLIIIDTKINIDQDKTYENSFDKNKNL